MDKARRDLVATGAQSYLDALVAIEAFRKAVQEICEGAYNRSRPRLSKAMGLDDKDCFAYSYDRRLADGKASVGVRRLVADGYYFYVYLHWSTSADGSQEIRAGIQLDVRSRTNRDEILSGIRQKKLTCQLEGGVAGDGSSYLTLERPLQAVEPDAISRTLDDLLAEWIESCGSIDDLKLIAAPTPAATAKIP